MNIFPILFQNTVMRKEILFLASPRMDFKRIDRERIPIVSTEKEF